MESKAVKDNSKESNKGRPSKLEYLLRTNQGKEQFEKLLMCLSSRASLRASALMIGVKPDTLTSWIKRGKQEPDSIYGEFWGRVCVAMATAVVEAEIEINQQEPKFYLQNGPGKFIVNDSYNIKGQGQFDYGADGSIAIDGKSETGLLTNESTNQQQPTIEHSENSIDDDLADEALKQMIELGINPVDMSRQTIKVDKDNVDQENSSDAQ